ncbi:Two-pore potassium channel 5 [Platanthera zijinensis]|uniref:Two-pore potassium channel 5 n=1 Tax=Platanthera zijinensis TaxID=2320716 RepID=A0AAP0B2P9_9ASPA
MLVILIHTLNLKGYSGFETRPIVDALYFHIISVCTTGYGDIDSLLVDKNYFLSFCVFWGWYSQHVILLHLLHN